jgi:hypothetical protein
MTRRETIAAIRFGGLFAARLRTLRAVYWPDALL